MSDDWTYKIEIRKGDPEARHGATVYLSTLLAPWIGSPNELKTKVKLQGGRNQNIWRGFLNPPEVCERAAELFANVIIEIKSEPVDFGYPTRHEFGPGTGSREISSEETLATAARDLVDALEEIDRGLDPSPWIAELRRHDTTDTISSNECFLKLQALQSNIKTAQQKKSEAKVYAKNAAREFLATHQIAKTEHFTDFGESIAKIETLSLSLVWEDEESKKYEWELRLWTSERKTAFLDRVKSSRILGVLFDTEKRVIFKGAEKLILDRMPGVVDSDGDCWMLNKDGEFEAEDYRKSLFETGTPVSRKGSVFFRLCLRSDGNFEHLTPGEDAEAAVSEMIDRLGFSDCDATITTYDMKRHEIARIALGNFFFCGFWFTEGSTLLQRIDATTGIETHSAKIQGSLSNLIGNPSSNSVIAETIHEKKCLIQVFSAADLSLVWSDESSFSSFSIASNSSRLFRCSRRGRLDVHDLTSGSVLVSISQEIPIDLAQVIASEDRFLVLGDARESENESNAFQYSLEGELLNSATFSVDAFPSCVLENGQVVIGQSGKVSFRFYDLSTVWSNDEESSLIMTSGNRIFTQINAETNDAAIVSLDGFTGEEIWRSPIPAFNAELGFALEDGSLIISDYEEKSIVLSMDSGKRCALWPCFLGGAVADDGTAFISDRASGFPMQSRIDDFSSLAVQLSSPPVEFQWIAKWKEGGRQGSRNNFVEIVDAARKPLR